LKEGVGTLFLCVQCQKSVTETLAMIRQPFREESMLSSGQIEKGDTGEDQSQEHAHHFL
jgi:hypothetical protein